MRHTGEVVENIFFKSQPPAQALRFSHRRGERKTRVTGDKPQGTMGRVQTAGEAPSRPLSPSSLPLRAWYEKLTKVVCFFSFVVLEPFNLMANLCVLLKGL